MARHEHNQRDGHSQGSEHGVEGEPTSKRKLALVSGINLVGFVVELAGGLLFGSVALISDAVHMLFDALAYVMALAAVYTAEQYERPGEWSYGLHRIEPAAALLNGVLLIPMAVYIAYAAYQRFLDPVSIDPVPTAVLATGGLLINLVSVYVLQGKEMSLNEEGAFYHLLGDTGASIAVIISMILIAVADLRIADPITAIFIALLVIWSAVRVLRDSTGILLERSPIPLEEVRTVIGEIDGVESVEDVHVWQICSQLTVGSIRIRDTAASLGERREIRNRIHQQLDELDIDHATVELIEAEKSKSLLGSHGHSSQNEHPAED